MLLFSFFYVSLLRLKTKQRKCMCCSCPINKFDKYKSSWNTSNIITRGCSHFIFHCMHSCLDVHKSLQMRSVFHPVFLCLSVSRADGLPEGASPAAVFARVWVHANRRLIHAYQCGSWSWRMAPGVRGENKPTRGGKTVRERLEKVSWRGAARERYAGRRERRPDSLEERE